MTWVSHWDEVETRTADDVPHLRATWRDLGRPAGSVGASARRVEVAPGCRSTPVHRHFDEEEHVYVLGGGGWSWQDGRLHAIGRDDAVVHLAGADARTVVAGPDGLDVLVFGAEPPAPVTFGSPHPSRREPAGLPGVPADERPRNICALSDVAPEREARGRTNLTSRTLSAHLGALRSRLRHVTLAAGAESWPPHCHSAEEEIFVVLDGSGAVVIGDESTPLRRGSCVARPPGTRVAHQFLGPLTFLAWSTYEPDDVVFYPRSKTVFLRGVGVRFRVDPLDPWDGEPG